MIGYIQTISKNKSNTNINFLLDGTKIVILKIENNSNKILQFEIDGVVINGFNYVIAEQFLNLEKFNSYELKFKNDVIHIKKYFIITTYNYTDFFLLFSFINMFNTSNTHINILIFIIMLILTIISYK